MKISLTMATASSSYPVDKKGPHLFDLILDSLEKQTFNDFEFIIVDAIHHKRKDFFQDKEYPFQIKHITTKPSIWQDKGMWALSSARNQGIIYSDGELVIFIDDTFGFEPDWLELNWKYYIKDGLFAQSLFEFYDVKGEKLIWDGKWIRDSRWEFIEEGSDHLTKHGGAYTHTLGDWFYGAGSAASMDMLLRVNGYDENFDGTKTLEDCDLGRRLSHLGCEFVFDKSLKIKGYYEHYPLETVTSDAPVKSNYPLVQVNLERPRIEVNKDRLTEEELKRVREESKKWGPPVNEELFTYWAKNQPIFDLRELREERLDEYM